MTDVITGQKQSAAKPKRNKHSKPPAASESHGQASSLSQAAYIQELRQLWNDAP